MESYTGYVMPVFMNLFRYFVMAGIPFLFFYLLFPKRFSRQKIQERPAKARDFRRELLHSLKSIGIFIATGIAILNSSFGGYSRYYDDLHAYPLWWIPVSIVLALVLYDTYFYWMHRAIHSKPLFRWVHLVHHRSTNPSPLASYAFNVLEAVLDVLGGVLIILLIPMHFLALLLLSLLIFAFNVYAHLGYEIMPRWFRHSILFECLNTSVHHNMHHRKFRGNYGIYFRFWDRLMRTEFSDYVETYDRIQARRFGPGKPQ